LNHAAAVQELSGTLLDNDVVFWLERNALRALTARLRERFPDRVQGIYAFGSRVRGDHHQWSDVDVPVVGKDRDPAIESEIIDIFIEEELKSGVSFSPVIKDAEAFDEEKKWHTPFYERIRREGVAFSPEFRQYEGAKRLTN